MDDVLAEHVLRAVEQVPEGHVVSYGDIAELVGIGPRQVGSVLSRFESGVPWWRVTNAGGDLPAHLGERARAAWRAEGIATKPNGLGCRIAAHRPDARAWAEAYEQATRDLPPVAAARMGRRASRDAGDDGVPPPARGGVDPGPH